VFAARYLPTENRLPISYLYANYLHGTHSNMGGWGGVGVRVREVWSQPVRAVLSVIVHSIHATAGSESHVECTKLHVFIHYALSLYCKPIHMVRVVITSFGYNNYREESKSGNTYDNKSKKVVIWAYI
jgi:hypothetical protein